MITDTSIFGIPFSDLRVSTLSSELPFFEGQKVLFLVVASTGGEYMTDRGFRVHISNRGNASYYKSWESKKRVFKVSKVTSFTFQDGNLIEQALTFALKRWGYDLGRDGAKVILGLSKAMPAIVDVLRELALSPTSPASLSVERLTQAIADKGL